MVDLSRLVPRMQPYAKTIFGETSALAAEYGAINLGQGFPDVDGPDELKRLAIASIASGSGNQYPPAHGLLDLREAIAEHQQHHYGLSLSPVTDVVVATGASEALAASVLALVGAGDEVIVFEPFFDLYPAIIAMAGATKVAVPLRVPGAGGSAGIGAARANSTDGNDRVGDTAPAASPSTAATVDSTAATAAFTLDVDALRSAVTPRTRMIILNSPHNPTGMVLTRDELDAIARVAIDNDLIVVSDEAYEHLVFDDVRHIPIATVPGMFDRTVTIGSGGKSFSFTGWKVGWASGPSDLIAAVRVVRQHLSYVSSGPFQSAVAAGLRYPDAYFEEFAADLAARRDFLRDGLEALGFGVFRSDGTYFIASDIRTLGQSDGRAFCDWLIRDVGVAAIPIEALCDDEERFAPYVRWTFCKQPAVLAEALDRLRTGLG